MKTVYFGGKITTMNPEMPTASAVVCEGGRFIYVGNDQGALCLAGESDRIIDLKGASAYPGFCDTHLHILNKAVTSRELELQYAGSREELLEMVRSAACAQDAPEFINGRGFNEDLWTDRRLPTKAELDAVSCGKPVMLSRVCGHIALVNSKAMEMSGVNADTPCPDGGGFDFEKGLLEENGLGLVNSDCGEKSVEKCMELLHAGMVHARENGLTSIYSDDYGTFGFSMQTVSQAYRLLEAEGRMPVRVVQQCALPDADSFGEFMEMGLGFMQGGDYYRTGPRKLYIDGSLGARTALISVPYADKPEKGKGIAIYTQDALNKLAAQTHACGFPFICHAIGDTGVSMVLNAIEYARSAVPGTDKLPDGIVHCQITSEKELKRIAELNAIVYAQPVFCEYDLHICRDRVGAALEKTSYNWKSLLDSGVTVVSGSDCPVEPLSPAMNIFCAVTRKDFGLVPEGGWLPEQKLSISEAIACHTTLAAACVGLDGVCGMIKTGYYADMTVYSGRLEDVDPDTIKDMTPLMTIVGGECDYR